MTNYKILLFKEKDDRAKNKVHKKIQFSGRYIDALRKAHTLSEQEKCKDFDVPIAPSSDGYKEFIKRFQKLTEKNKEIVVNTLSNIFTMRLIGNKTHGDLAEVGIAELQGADGNVCRPYHHPVLGWIRIGYRYHKEWSGRGHGSLSAQAFRHEE